MAITVLLFEMTWVDWKWLNGCCWVGFSKKARSPHKSKWLRFSGTHFTQQLYNFERQFKAYASGENLIRCLSSKFMECTMVEASEYCNNYNVWVAFDVCALRDRIGVGI